MDGLTVLRVVTMCLRMVDLVVSLFDRYRTIGAFHGLVRLRIGRVGDDLSLLIDLQFDQLLEMVRTVDGKA